MRPEIAAALRTVLIALGGYAVGKNWLDMPALETIVGAVVILAGAAWGIYSKRPSSKEAQAVAETVATTPDVAPQIVKLEPGQVVRDESRTVVRSESMSPGGVRG